VPASKENTTRLTRVKELFGRAASLDRAERDVYFQSACSDDPSLRAEVEELLEQHDRSYGPLETRAASAFPSGAGRAPPSLIADRFEIGRQLGVGGMGEVYHAHDRELGEDVALKMVRSDLVSDPRIRDRFRREILNGRRVTHPNVCRIYDLVSDHSPECDSLCFTMELLAGETLADLLKREGRLSTERALPLARQMAAGLSALHECNIVHRDCKPANVMLVEGNGKASRVKLTDFGLARHDAGSEEGGLPSLSGSKDIVGTPIYMAPEQLIPERDKIGPATDVYAFGLVLYEMVTGQRPFAAESYPQNLVAKTMQQPRPPTEHVPDLDPKWNNTILACLLAEPEDRPQSSAAVLEMLEGRVEPPAPRRRRSARRIWATVAAMVAILVALSTQFERLLPVEVPDVIRVAFLPGATSGDDSENFAAFAGGLMSRVVTGLTRYEEINDNLTVMDPTTVVTRKVTDLAKAARDLNTNVAIVWDLADRGDHLALTLRILEAATGRRIEVLDLRVSRDNEPALRASAIRELASAMNLQPVAGAADSEIAGSATQLGAQEFYDTGLGYLHRSHVTDEIDNAITQFRKATDLDDRFALAHAGLCQANIRMRSRTADPQFLWQARTSCDRALWLDPTLPEVLIAAGDVDVASGEYDEAITKFLAAIEADEQNADAYVSLANAYGRVDRIEEAEATFRKAIARRPEDWRMWKQLGLFYFNRREFEKAIEPFAQIEKLTPGSPQALVNLAAAIHACDPGNAAQLKPLYERINDIEPRPASLSNLAMIYFREQRYDEQVDLLEQAVEIEPHNYKMWQYLATAYEYAAEDTKAVEAYLKCGNLIEDEALSDNPELHELYGLAAHCYAGADQIGQAEYWLERAVERRDAANEKEMLINAKTFAKLGDIDSAFEWLRAAEDRGMLRDEIGQELETRRWLQPLLLDPRAAEFLNPTQAAFTDIH